MIVPPAALRVETASAAALFVAAPPDPWSPAPAAVLGRPALEYAIAEWLARRGQAPARIEIVFTSPPADARERERRLALPAAFARHCETRVEESRHRLALVHRRGRRAIALGLAALAVCIGLAGLFGSDIAPGPALLRETLAEAFTVIGWVALWLPVETALVDPLEHRREIRLLRALGRLPVSLGEKPPA